MRDYTGVVLNPSGEVDYGLGEYFELDLERAMAWFDGDGDDVPAGYTKQMVSYDTGTGTIQVEHTRVVTRFLPGPCLFAPSMKLALERWRDREHCRVSDRLLHRSSNAHADFIQLEDDGISFMPQSQNIRRVSELADGVYKPFGRHTAKPGKIVRKLLRDGSCVTDGDIERFANLVKGLTLMRHPQIHVVHGEEIRAWYSGRNAAPQQGSLSNSCMRHDSCQPFFDIYTKNPSVGLAILTNELGELIGRALVWEMCNETGEPLGQVCMDRVYGKDATIALFHAYALANGWWRRDYEMGSMGFVDPSGERQRATIFSKLIESDFRRANGYPYLDNMKFLDLQQSIIHNNSTYPYDINLGHQNGRYERVDRRGRVFRRWFTGEPPLAPCSSCGNMIREDAMTVGGDGRDYCQACWSLLWFRCHIDGQVHPVSERVTIILSGYPRTVSASHIGDNTLTCCRCRNRMMAYDRYFVSANGTEEEWCSSCVHEAHSCYRCGRRYLGRHECLITAWEPAEDPQNDEAEDDIIIDDGDDGGEDE